MSFGIANGEAFDSAASSRAACGRATMKTPSRLCEGWRNGVFVVAPRSFRGSVRVEF